MVPRAGVNAVSHEEDAVLGWGEDNEVPGLYLDRRRDGPVGCHAALVVDEGGGEDLLESDEVAFMG